MSLSESGPYAIWLGVGILLCIAEMLLPGVFLMWIGIAALLTGVATFILPLGFGLQMLVFALLGITSVYFGRRWTASNAIASDDPMLNDRMARLIGQHVTLVEPIVDGEGRAQVGDGQWNVRGPDAPAGTRMTVTGSSGSILTVAFPGTDG